MNNSFSYRSRSTSIGRRRLLAATLLIVVVFIIDSITGGKIRALVREGVAGVSSAFDHIAGNVMNHGYFETHAALAAQNATLQAEVNSLQAQIALTNSLKAQNTSLQELVHLAQTQQGIAAPVASSFIASPYGTFLIGAGSAQGITQGSLVLTGENVVIGEVSNVGTDSATVLELLAPGSTIDAQLDGSSIVAHGKGGGNALAEAPNGLVITTGDSVTAPEFNERVIGIVGHVDSDPSNATQQVSIGLPVNLSSLQYVYVVLK
ncbi:MAG TPA: rod shape-determining protein MreC [Candidatus Paceibacterota bacterium]|nr:rod shape-determining protein MreC [Candidatus Paceibacterota bacterium]